MSAYALPGLFPPLPTSTRSNAGSSIGGSTSTAGFSATSSSKTFFPLTPNHNNLFNKNNSMHHPHKSSSSYGSGSSFQADNKVDIAVLEPKIDSALLIQAVTTPAPTNINSMSGRHSLRRRRKVAAGSAPPQANSSDALQFELSISFGGRTYKCVRSLPSIEQFRRDLMREIPYCEIPELPTFDGDDNNKCSNNTSKTHSHSNSGGSSTSHSNASSSGSSRPSVLGRSFSFLYALLRSYVPVLERWLKTVASMVPKDNPILSQFLAETVMTNLKLEQELSKRQQQSLDAIEESESDEDEDDDDDDESKEEEQHEKDRK